MVCIAGIPDKMVSTAMWVTTIILGIGIIVLFLNKYKKIQVSDNAGPFMILIGFLGTLLIGVATSKKNRESFSKLYGF